MQETSQEIGDIFTKEGIGKLKTGQVLRFLKDENTIVELQITKINRKSCKVWAQDIKTYHPDEVRIKDAFGNETEFSEDQL